MEDRRDLTKWTGLTATYKGPRNSIRGKHSVIAALPLSETRQQIRVHTHGASRMLTATKNVGVRSVTGV